MPRDQAAILCEARVAGSWNSAVGEPASEHIGDAVGACARASVRLHIAPVTLE
jgi:hypothetical protein